MKEQLILDTAFRLFAEKGIETVTMPEIAAACGVGKATLYRYFSLKADLVVTIATRKWKEYVETYRTSVSEKKLDRMTGAEFLRFYLDSFIDLYRRHKDILRFNYNFNSFLRYDTVNTLQKQQYLGMVEQLGRMFHGLYQRGMKDGTLNAEIPEEVMFSSPFHIMLAAATRYSVGLIYVSGKTDPCEELVMLKELLVSRFCRDRDADREGFSLISSG